MDNYKKAKEISKRYSIPGVSDMVVFSMTCAAESMANYKDRIFKKTLKFVLTKFLNKKDADMCYKEILKVYRKWD